MVSPSELARSIHVVRGQRVMLDEDLARLYEVPTKSLNLAVKRNRGRFPIDFCFQLTAEETTSLRFQSETSKNRGGRRYLPWVFTQEGIAMLSGVLSSPRAIAVNIEIMRAFVALRRALTLNDEIAKRLAVVEAKLDQHRAEFASMTTKTGAALAEHDQHIRIVFETIRRLMADDEPKPPARVGFDLD
jgi:hypothetical protein